MQRLILILYLSITLFLPIQAQYSWTSKTNLPAVRYQAAAFSIGKYGYVGTGIGRNGVYLNDFWRYDPETDTWAQIDSMPTGRRAAANVFVINNKGYVACGAEIRPNPIGEFWEYDPESGKWTRKADFPPPLHCCQEWMESFALGDKGYIYVGASQMFYSYDPLKDKWTRLTDTNIPFATQRVSFSIGPKGYVGLGYDGKYTTDFWEYDPTKESWTRVADFPAIGRVDAVGFSVGNHGYAGLGHKGTKFFHDFWEYHPDTNTWKQIDSLYYEADFPIGMSIGSKGYVGTGFNLNGGYPRFWEYTPQTTSIWDPELSQSIRISPNPADDRLFIQWENADNRTFAIYSLNGILVRSGPLNESSIYIGDFSSGFYLLKIFTPKNVFCQKFIKR